MKTTKRLKAVDRLKIFKHSYFHYKWSFRKWLTYRTPNKHQNELNDDNN